MKEGGPGEPRLKRVGFFEEMDLEDAKKEIESLIGPPQASEAEILRYLEGGLSLALTLGEATDIVTGVVIGHGIRVLTDGEWVWTSDVAHYVRAYHFRVPGPFIERMKGLSWRCPRPGAREVDLIRRLLRGRGR